MKKYIEVKKSFGGMIHTVSAGFEFILVASGRLDARIAQDPYGYDWDYAPGSLLVEEAGGIVRNHGSNKYDYTNHDYIATNPVIYTALTEGENSIFG